MSTEIEQYPPPEGFHWTWKAEDPSWFRLLAPGETPKRCRFTVGPGGTSCKADSVARMHRGGLGDGWWHYCGDHLYSRRIRDGVLEHRILEADDPA